MMALLKKVKFELFLLIAFAIVLTLTLQRYVGNPMLYWPRGSMKATTEIHEAILHNRLPPGKSWTDYGGSGVNIRVGVIYLAEFLSHQINRPVLEVYQRIDTIFIFLSFLAFFFFLRQFLDPEYSLMGVCYLAFTFIHSYHFHFFHPWDRVSVFCWIVSLSLLWKDHFIGLLFSVLVATVVKYDIIMIAGLYGLYHFRPGSYRKAFLGAATLFLTSYGTMKALSVMLPNGFPILTAKDSFQNGIDLFLHIAKSNILDIHDLRVNYPPLLAFFIPLLISLFQVQRQEKFVQSAAILSYFGLIFYFFASRFVEVRAEYPMLMMLLPSALQSLRHILRRDVAVRCA